MTSDHQTTARAMPICRHGWTLEHGCRDCLGPDDWHVYSRARAVRCPDSPDTNDIYGCGRAFRAVPDAEGWLDCPYCGLAFEPDHPHNQPQPDQEATP